jgi:hypothetical protein
MSKYQFSRFDRVTSDQRMPVCKCDYNAKNLNDLGDFVLSAGGYLHRRCQKWIEHHIEKDPEMAAAWKRFLEEEEKSRGR